MSDTLLQSPAGGVLPPPQQDISVPQAQQRMRARLACHAAPPLNLGLPQALGHVLAADIRSPIDVPAHDNSAMDGWAFRGDALRGQDLVLREVGSAFAGKAFTGAPGPSECVRIMTGAVMPAGCDTVIPQEFARRGENDTIIVPAEAVRPGDHRRARGEDLALGKIALASGRVLRPADLGLLASLGIGEVAVRPRLRVAIFSTGDELRVPGQRLDEGCIYDSNRFTLHGMLTRLGCEVIDLGNVKDEPQALEAMFRKACEQADAIITSGGVSVGEADYTREVMGRLGDVEFWRIAMRPGRPMAFGQIESNGTTAALFGLPGNPVAVMVTFYFLVRGALLHMMAARDEAPPMLRVPALAPIRKKPGRTEYQRGLLVRDQNGNPGVRITGSQGSGILRSMSEANCMVVLGHDQGNVEAGDNVDVVLFDGLV